MRRTITTAALAAILAGIPACGTIKTAAHNYAHWPDRVCRHHGGVKRIAILKGGVRVVRCNDGHVA